MKLDLSRISDTSIRAALQTIQDTYNGNVINLGEFKLIKIDHDAAVTNRELFHNMGFIPTDIILAKATGTITFHYSTFTKEKLFYTTTGAVSARVFVGSLGDS